MEAEEAAAVADLMTPQNLRRWSDSGWKAAGTLLHNSNTWWPQGQAEASIWALCTFVAMSGDIATLVGGDLHLATGMAGSKLEKTYRRARGTEAGGATPPIPGLPDTVVVGEQEILVDLSLHRWSKTEMSVLAVGESEMSANWRVLRADRAVDDYAWDFWKLLLISAPIRLFMARVGGTQKYGDEGPTPTVPMSRGERRRSRLLEALKEVASQQRSGNARVGSVGVVLLPTAAAEWESTRFEVI